MPKRCANKKCGSLVSARRPHVRVGELVFCHGACEREYREANLAPLEEDKRKTDLPIPIEGHPV